MKKSVRKNKWNNEKLLERGGLMIEALAMLGLIAVVTPTMYKKSAERTLEVEDINTATTVRTYMNAVEAYMANEYGTFVSEPDEGAVPTAHTVKKGHFYEDPTNPAAFGSRDGPAHAYYVDNAELANYLPYGFDVNRAMYDYNAPETRIVKNGNNLTAFVRFRAINGQADGIGQERTARIASLVGSTGGYMPNDSTARGVGGIWSLSSGNLDNLFGNDAAGGGNANTYSLVTASANVAMDVNGGQMDNDKYLQRTKENSTPGTDDEIWRNTMRTDLYLGGHLGNETQTLQEGDDGSKRYSIRNIQSLIVGADQAEMVSAGSDEEGNPLPDVESSKYGLYITGTANADYSNAYIGGTLAALRKGFYVTTGEKIDNAEDDEYAGTQFLIGEDNETDYTTEIRGDGDITNAGANGILLGNFVNEAGSTVTIGDMLGAGGAVGVGLTLLNDGDNQYEYFLGENIQIYDDKNKPANDGVTLDQVLLFDNGSSPQGYNLIPANVEGGLAAPTAFTNTYVGGRKYQVRIGANTLVDALLSARQVDTQKLRTATLSAGSADIDDADKWLNVDQYGTIIETPTQLRDTIGNTKLALVNPQKGSTDGIYLQIKDGTGLGFDASRKTTFYTDSDGLSYSQTHGNQSAYVSAYVEEDENSSFSATAGSISLTARNGSTSEGTKQKGTITLSAQDGTDASGNAIPGIITAKNSKMKMVMGEKNSGRDLTISNAAGESTTHGDTVDKDFRVHMLGGWLDLENAGFHVSKGKASVFSVNVMDKKWERFTNKLGDNWTDDSGSAMSNDTVYATATHGPAIFTNFVDTSEDTPWIDTDQYESYLSIGAYLNEATVNITDGGQQNVLLVDGKLEKDDIDPTYSDYSGGSYTLSGWGGSDTIEPGTVYIRKGRIELVPEVSASKHSAQTGSGSIAAERFVANNRDSEGNRIEVPQLVNSTFVTSNYEGDSYERYDTYMVNPAYTSVMHDIKLTTRGGARLSDILPDFINKGIYIASNTVKEGANDRKMEFKLTGSGVEGFGADTAAGAYDYVSPYMGIVPAPQCPPGYGRVITLNPVSFEVAQVGTPRLQKLADGKYTYYTATEDIMPSAMSDGSTGTLLTDVTESGGSFVPNEGHVMHDTHRLKPRPLNVQTPVLPAGSALSEDGGSADGKNDRTWSATLDTKVIGNRVKIDSSTDSTDELKFKVTNLEDFAAKLEVTTPTNLTEPDNTKPYVLGYATDDVELSSGKVNVFRPVTFQQSTFLKSAAVPLVMNKTKKFGDTAGEGEYTSGWAVLMGFIYPYDHYKTVIDHLGVDQFSSFATGFYWNIFPVLRDRLEAYATIYCYFDRDNLYGQNTENDTSGGIKHIDPYNYLESLPTSFRKQSHGDYIERLNDPTLDYYEEW